ncbi:glycosyltransferase family 1 protein [Luteimonas aestuarii]|uniref:Glycosyltransferase family 1 protein n=1 Tax=Luteimonas aestuarii TaxID=453837 RepID=A0A4R5U567_9GAMM|nr:glycosyltransferase family 1 protein [Luteimonas aestuarii]TDK28733.1 glycosyltransferase family 1 protein [Luteimonas aestuarii]
MRYAIVTETYPPEVNGVALTVQSLEQGLRARGHAVCVVRPAQAGMRPGREGDQTRVASVPMPRYAGLRIGLPCAGRLQRLWRDARPDAIYVATEGPLGWSAVRAARKLGIPVATGFHTRFDEYMRDYGLPWLQPVAMRWMRHFHNSAQATLVPTRALGDFLQASGFHEVRLLRRAVDTVLFDPAKRDEGIRSAWLGDDAGPVVIHVGRIAAEKNLDLAVRAFRALQQAQPGARYVWVGDGPMRERLSRHNPDFIFLGIQRGEALARLFASADLFAFPSTTETFGNVTLEAMASGLATVAYDYGAAHEHLRDGGHGAAVPLQDEATFVEAVVRIGSDAALRRAMGAAARDAVHPLSPDRVSADFDALLAGLAGRETGHARLATA